MLASTETVLDKERVTDARQQCFKAGKAAALLVKRTDPALEV
jgi:hypothetical protein